MAIRITAIHIPSGTEHADVAEVEWVSIEHKNEGCSRREAIVDWLESDPTNIAVVGRGSKATPVTVMRDGERAWIQAVFLGAPSNKLLELPRY